MFPTEVTFCATGIFFLESSQLLSVTSVSMQPNLMAKASISLLMGAAWLGILRKFLESWVNVQDLTSQSQMG
jgi:hypothetical protein